jgi:hypothetical protein
MWHFADLWFVDPIFSNYKYDRYYLIQICTLKKITENLNFLDCFETELCINFVEIYGIVICELLKMFACLPLGNSISILIQICTFQKIGKKENFLRQSCSAFCRNLRIFDLRINHKNLVICCGLAHKTFQNCDSGMSPRTCRFIICGLLKNVYLPTLDFFLLFGNLF